MKGIVYSPTSREKLLHMRQYITMKFGAQAARKALQDITTQINQLTVFENSGESVQDLLGINVDYRILVISHNYVFYRIDEHRIYIVNIYDDREDFMQKLFGGQTD